MRQMNVIVDRVVAGNTNQDALLLKAALSVFREAYPDIIHSLDMCRSESWTPLGVPRDYGVDFTTVRLNGHMMGRAFLRVKVWGYF